MGYFIDPDGNYPRHAGDIQLLIPEWNEETDPLPDGWINVEAGVLPEIPENHYLLELPPKLVKNKYVRQFKVLPMEVPNGN